MYIARTPYAHGPGEAGTETRTGIALRLAQQSLVRLDDLMATVGASNPIDNAERAARALRLEQLHARAALWWAIVVRHSGHSSVPFIYVKAAIAARSKAEDSARFWRDSAADWTARALRQPTSDCAGAMSNWDDLGVNDLGRPHLAETVPPVPQVASVGADR